jgi:signal transduction histidine kinase
VACRWRIRHKLMLGLGLVVAITALLLAGTLKGLSSYRATMKTMESKLTELDAASDFQRRVTEVKHALENAPNPAGLTPAELANTGADDGKADTPPRSPFAEAEAAFRRRVTEARAALQNYKISLLDTIKLKRDPDRGYNEMQQVQALEKGFTRLERAMERAGSNAQVISGASNSLILTDTEVVKLVNDLISTAGDLHNAINWTLKLKIERAGKDYKVSLAIVIATSVLGVLLTASLLRFFYGWVFYPIRDLEQGAGRVAQGDFEHRIVVNSGDEMQDLAAAFNDMTGRLREMYRDLARQVNERSRQLVRSERLAGVGFLAAGVAHEINNPLASIAFCSEALERRLAGAFPAAAAGENGDRETIHKYLKMIQQEAFRCKEITERLLKFSRGGERRREPADLVELTQGVLDMVQHLQNCKGKRLVFNRPERLVAWVNAQEVKSVVLNLVVNALDSMDDGGTLTLTLRQRDQMAELVFADTGCGMTAEVLENIFEPFYTRSRTGKGTGLGLSISHRIITQHGGEIEATSPGPSQGSTFTVRLPLRPAEAPAPAAPAEGEYPVFPAQQVPPLAA